MRQLLELPKQQLSPNDIIIALKTLPTYQEKQDWLMKKDLIDYIKRYTFFLASEEGDLDIVKILVECQDVNPAIDDNYALLIATVNGRLEVVKFLATLPNVDPKALNGAFYIAASNDKLEIVKFLAHSFYNPFKLGLSSKVKNQHLQLLDLLPEKEKKDLMKSLLIEVNQNCIHLFFSNTLLPVSKDVERFIAKTIIDYDLQMSVKSN